MKVLLSPRRKKSQVKSGQIRSGYDRRVGERRGQNEGTGMECGRREDGKTGCGDEGESEDDG